MVVLTWTQIFQQSCSLPGLAEFCCRKEISCDNKVQFSSWKCISTFYVGSRMSFRNHAASQLFIKLLIPLRICSACPALSYIGMWLLYFDIIKPKYTRIVIIKWLLVTNQLYNQSTVTAFLDYIWPNKEYCCNFCIQINYLHGRE